MRELYLISTFQAKRLLRVRKSALQEILNTREIDYVRDTDQVYRISLESLLLYAESNLISIDKVYLYSLKTKIHPWREITDAPSSFVVTRSSGSPKKPEPSSGKDELFPPEAAASAYPDLKKMGFSARALTIFKAHGITTAEELIQYSAQELRTFDNLGRKTLNGIRSVLKKYDLSLRFSIQQR